RAPRAQCIEGRMKESPNQRLFLAIAIWRACFLARSTFFPDWFGRKPAHPGAQAAAAEGTAPAAAAPAPPIATVATADGPKAEVPRGTSPRPPARRVEFGP